MNMNSGNDRSEDGLGNMAAVGLPIGAGFGVALGLVLDNLALGIAIGAAMGMAIGASLGRRGLVKAGGAETSSRGRLIALVGIGLTLVAVVTGLVLFILLAAK